MAEEAMVTQGIGKSRNGEDHQTSSAFPDEPPAVRVNEKCASDMCHEKLVPCLPGKCSVAALTAVAALLAEGQRRWLAVAELATEGEGLIPKCC